MMADRFECGSCGAVVLIDCDGNYFGDRRHVEGCPVGRVKSLPGWALPQHRDPGPGRKHAALFQRDDARDWGDS